MATDLEKEVKASSEAEASTEWLVTQVESLCRDRLCLPDESVAECNARILVLECAPDLLKAAPSSSQASGASQGANQQQNSMRAWQACFLYIAKRLNVKARGNSKQKTGSSRLRQDPEVERSFTVTQLLKACDVSFVEFARELRHIVARMKMKISSLCIESGDDDETIESLLELDELSMNFCHMSVLFIKYKDKFQHLFTPPTMHTASPNLRQAKSRSATAGGMASACDSRWEEDEWFRLGWLTYVVCKSKLLPKYPDLVSCASLLVCVLNFLLAHMPPSRLRRPLNDPIAYPVRTSTGATYTLGCVAFLIHAHLHDAQKLMPRVDSYLLELLSKDPVIERCEPVVDAVIMTGCGNYKGLLAVGAAGRQLEIIDRTYEEFYRLSAEVDDRDFAQSASNRAMGNSLNITPKLNKLSPLDPSRDTRAGSQIKANWPSPFRSHNVANMPASPALLNRTVPPTPISEAMAATQWLRKAIGNHIDGCSSDLERIFAEHKDKDVKNQIESFVHELADKVLPAVGGVTASTSSTSTSGRKQLNGSAKRGSKTFSSEAVKRKNEGIALYFHVLEAILLAEERRNGSSVLGALLLNKELHVSLVAFAFEVLADCYKMTVLSFPTVLNRLGLCAFDMCKVIEPLVRSEVNLNLPKEVKRHLYAIEEISLESLSWKPGSSFYKYMVEARGKTKAAAESEREELVNSNSAFQPVNSLPNTFGRPENMAINAASSSPAEKILMEFFKKVTKLCTFRLIDLCNRLERDCMFKIKDGEELFDAALILEEVIQIVQYVVYEQTRLLYNRHIDQIILAALYGVCKVHQIGVTFREIVHHYSKQSQCKQEVYRAVVIQQSYPELQVEETGDIILFYNTVFVPVVQNELINLLNSNARAAGNGAKPHAGSKSPPRTPPRNQRGRGSNNDENVNGNGKSPGAGSNTLPASVYPMRKIAGNVFASQLPDHKKQEYLLASPRSHSLFTFIGESTHAYQSPSRRLDMINTKLNQASNGNGQAASGSDQMLTSQPSVSESHQPQPEPPQRTKRMKVAS